LLIINSKFQAISAPKAPSIYSDRAAGVSHNTLLYIKVKPPQQISYVFLKRTVTITPIILYTHGCKTCVVCCGISGRNTM